MSPPGTFSINSALATPSKVMVGNHDHLAVSRRNRKRHVHRIGLRARRCRGRRRAAAAAANKAMLRPVGEELAERPLAGRNHEKIETLDQRRDIALLDPAIFDPAAATA